MDAYIKCELVVACSLSASTGAPMLLMNSWWHILYILAPTFIKKFEFYFQTKLYQTFEVQVTSYDD